jgi:hypothetical protein
MPTAGKDCVVQKEKMFKKSRKCYRKGNKKKTIS